VPLIEDMRAYGLQWLGGGCEAGAIDLHEAHADTGLEPAAALV
jgi:hypothetical protein